MSVSAVLFVFAKKKTHLEVSVLQIVLAPWVGLDRLGSGVLAVVALLGGLPLGVLGPSLARETPQS